MPLLGNLLHLLSRARPHQPSWDLCHLSRLFSFASEQFCRHLARPNTKFNVAELKITWKMPIDPLSLLLPLFSALHLRRLHFGLSFHVLFTSRQHHDGLLNFIKELGKHHPGLEYLELFPYQDARVRKWYLDKALLQCIGASLPNLHTFEFLGLIYFQPRDLVTPPRSLCACQNPQDLICSLQVRNVKKHIPQLRHLRLEQRDTRNFAVDSKAPGPLSGSGDGCPARAVLKALMEGIAALYSVALGCTHCLSVQLGPPRTVEGDITNMSCRWEGVRTKHPIKTSSHDWFVKHSCGERRSCSCKADRKETDPSRKDSAS